MTSFYSRYCLIIGLAVGTMILMERSAQAIQVGNVAVNGELVVQTDYVTRGRTQTEEGSAVSLGIDAEFTNGIYTGAWASNVDFDDAGKYELDLYLGIRGEEKNGFRYDFGYVRYLYPGNPNGTQPNYDEVYLHLGGGPFTFSWYELADAEDRTVSFGDDTYYAIALDFELPKGFGIGFHAGYNDRPSGQYWDYSVSVSIIGISFVYSAIEAASGTDPNTLPLVDRENRLVVGYGWTF